MKRLKLGVLLVVGALLLTACGGDDGKTSIHVNGFSILEHANKDVFEAYEATPAGATVKFRKSYGASGDQSRGVASGNKADIVHYSLESDITRLVKAGIVAEDWNTGPTKGIATSSVVAFIVKEGNPKNIQTWDDLIRDDVEVITPNPGSSGSARWNVLAAWAHVVGNGGTEDEAKAFLAKLFKNAVALPGSGREATTAFTTGTGDVLISYENEAILARASEMKLDYVVPAETLLIENPAAVVKSAGPEARAFFDFLIGPEAQAIYARDGYRPVIDGVTITEVPGAADPKNPYPTPEKLFTINDEMFGGWSNAADRFFGDGTEGKPLGIITAVQAEVGKGAKD